MVFNFVVGSYTMFGRSARVLNVSSCDRLSVCRKWENFGKKWIIIRLQLLGSSYGTPVGYEGVDSHHLWPAVWDDPNLRQRVWKVSC